MPHRLTAKNIMTKDIHVARENTTVGEAIRILFSQRVTGLPVVDKKHRLIGVVSDYDLISQIRKRNKKDLTHALLKDTITFSKKIRSLHPTDSLGQIVSDLVKTKLRRFPVVDGKGRLVGMVTRRDLVRVFYYQAKFAKK